MRWEYRVVADPRKNANALVLNELGADGWELVQVHRLSEHGGFIYYVKRPAS